MSAKPNTDAHAADEAVEAPSKSKKKLVIAIVAVIVAALAAGGSWFYMSRQHALDDGEEEAVHAPPPKTPPTYLPLDTMVVNLADPGGERVVQVGVILELSTSKATEKVKPYLPIIRNSVLLLVSQRKAEELLTREGKEQLAADIMAAASSHFVVAGAVGKNKKSNAKADEEENPVRGVLFASLIVQ